VRRLRQDRVLVLVALPGLAVLLVFHYLPLLGNVIAFQDYSPFVGIPDSPFVGLDNFQRLLGDPGFWHVVLNTLQITTFQLVFYFPIPIALALLLNSVMSERIKTFVQSVVYLPHFFSWVLVIALFQQMVGGAGLMNQVLRAHALATFDIMTFPRTFLLLVTIVIANAAWVCLRAIRSPSQLPLAEAAYVESGLDIGAGRGELVTSGAGGVGPSK